MFNDYLGCWGLDPDGAPIVTRSSRILPVRRQGVPAILKIAVEDEEKRGGSLMAWWDGQGAARVLVQAGDAVLLERAMGKQLLADFARNGKDDEASRIICTVVAKLHMPRAKAPPDLVPLSRWFQDLAPAARVHGSILSTSAATAQELLGAPRDMCVLHGDVHHGNVLDFGERGWLAIDPKALIGERDFDYANLFCNPDHETAVAPGRFARQIEIVTNAAGLERRRLLQWALAWAGLSATWHLKDGTRPETAMTVAEIAAAQLRG